MMTARMWKIGTALWTICRDDGSAQRYFREPLNSKVGDPEREAVWTEMEAYYTLLEREAR